MVRPGSHRHHSLARVQRQRQRSGRGSGGKLGLELLLGRGKTAPAPAPPRPLRPSRQKRRHEARAVGSELSVGVVSPTEDEPSVGQRERVEGRGRQRHHWLPHRHPQRRFARVIRH
eukprot:scaffold31634_cov93-Isochrysis_galbana.AAC.2